MKSGHTGRGTSGALYLQSATAGVISNYEGCVCVVKPRTLSVMTDGSRATDGCEPCQVGNQAALSNLVCVPWVSLSRTGNANSAHKFISNFGVWSDFVPRLNCFLGEAE